MSQKTIHYCDVCTKEMEPKKNSFSVTNWHEEIDRASSSGALNKVHKPVRLQVDVQISYTRFQFPGLGLPKDICSIECLRGAIVNWLEELYKFKKKIEENSHEDTHT